MAEILNYTAPRSLTEALQVLAAGPATILAGGTDLMPQSRAGRVRFAPTLLNIQGIAALRGISRHNGAIEIGTLTYGSMRSILDNKLDRQSAHSRPADTLPVLHPNIRGPRYYH